MKIPEHVELDDRWPHTRVNNELWTSDDLLNVISHGPRWEVIDNVFDYVKYDEKLSEVLMANHRRINATNQ